MPCFIETPEFSPPITAFKPALFEVTEDGLFGQILPEQIPADAVDLQGSTVIPGLIDVHIHGSRGADFSDGDYDGLVSMAQYLLQEGITSFVPASMTLPYPVLEKAFACGASFKENSPEDCARLMGIHMEGPYFSEKKKGWFYNKCWGQAMSLAPLL